MRAASYGSGARGALRRRGVAWRRLVRRRGAAVDEDAELLGDDGAAGGRGGGEHGGRRRRGVAAVFVGEVDGGDVVDAGAALVLAAGVEADEVLLRVARHLRRRPRRHEVPGDASPVAPPELLQACQESLVLILGPWNP